MTIVNFYDEVDDSYENPPQIAYGNYSIWRLMIDDKFQNRGYGRAAMELALDFIRTFPCGEGTEENSSSYDIEKTKNKIVLLLT